MIKEKEPLSLPKLLLHTLPRSDDTEGATSVPSLSAKGEPQASQTLEAEAAQPSRDLAGALPFQSCPATGGECGKAEDAGAPEREAHPCAQTSTGWWGLVPIGPAPLTPAQPGSPLGTKDSDSTPPAVPPPR